jgi:hypothetical protein
MNELEERAWKIYCHETKNLNWDALPLPLKKIYLAKAANEPFESAGSVGEEERKLMYQDEGLGYEEAPPPSGSYS